MLMEALEVRAGQTVCDMGCGNGFYALELARMVGDEGLVYAVDIQPEMLRMLAERAGYRISDRSIDVQITRLRKKLNDDPPRYLKTVRHVGYMLCPAG